MGESMVEVKIKVNGRVEVFYATQEQYRDMIDGGSVLIKDMVPARVFNIDLPDDDLVYDHFC